MLRQRIRDANIWRVYAATFAVGLAYGLAISLTSLFLDDRGFDKSAIGSLAAWFALGIVGLSLPMGALIRRFSAKSVLLCSLFGYAVCITAFGQLHDYWSIAAVRFCDGACSVGVWVSCETILLSRADRSNKAFITSLYAIALAVGYVAGPVLARGLVAFTTLPAAFAAAGALALLAFGYVALKLERGPDANSEAEQHSQQAAAPVPGTLLWRIKTSCFATYAYGYFQASVVLFLPLYLIESKGIAREQTILIPAFFAAGMLLFSNVVGRIGDAAGHLAVMRVLAAIGTGMILGFVFLDSYWLMCAAVFVAGASLAGISPVSLALQGVVATPAEYSRATSIYNAFYAAGMLLGPPLSSALFTRWGGAVMLYHLAAIWAAFVVFASIFHRDDPAGQPATAPDSEGAVQVSTS